MRNLWIQTERAFATWVADLAVLRTRPSALVSIVEAILEAGNRHRVFTPMALPRLDFRRGDGPTLAERLWSRWQDQRAIDLFAFTGAAVTPDAPGSSTVVGTVSYYDAADHLIDAAVADLGAVLRALEPVPDSIPPGFMRPYPPVRITGLELVYDDARAAPIADHADRPVEVRIAIHADLWFPFVFGSAHPEADHQRMFDNRALAERHTPRLNAFLVEVGQLATAAGGAWRVDEDATGGNAILWLDERGIRVDAAEPALMPASALAAPW